VTLENAVGPPHWDWDTGDVDSITGETPTGGITGRGAAKGGAGPSRRDGAGVIGENVRLEWVGEVGRENAVLGRVGGSMGETGGPSHRETRGAGIKEEVGREG